MEGTYANGHFVQPTIWTGLPESSTIIREEIFGPCCHIAPFDTEEEAIALANNTDYGLAATLVCGDRPRAERIAGQLVAGTVWVNCFFVRDLRAPFGGSRKSGIGREGGVWSFDFYADVKNTCYSPNGWR